MKLAVIYWCATTLLFTVIGQEMSQVQRDKVNDDLNLYLKSLNQIAEFYKIRKYYLNTVVHFGLFISNVNLKKALWENGGRLPASIKIRLKKLISKTDELAEIAGHTLDNINDDGHEETLLKDVLTLFSNETQWISQVEQFYDKNPHSSSYDATYVKNLYPSWRSYMNSIDPFRGSPTPMESDKCLSNLSRNPVNYSNRMKLCDLPLFCRRLIDSGSDNGYGLTHRLLLLQMARFGRRCHVVSNAEDRYARTNFCANSYREGLYIDINGFKTFDLFLEQIFLCALEGYAEFIRRRWLIQIISYQEGEGCFPDSTDTDNLQSVRSIDLPNGHNLTTIFSMLKGRCNGHTTALAAGVLGAAIRFLLETSY